MSRTWIYVGHLQPGQTSLMRLNALRRHGAEVVGYDTSTTWHRQSYLQRRLAVRTEKGKAVRQINEGLVRLAREVRPGYVWFDKQEYIAPATMEELRSVGARLVFYTPDPYFAVSWKRTRLMDACLPMFDLLVTSKSYELEHYSAVGPQCLYMPLGYCDETHKPIAVPESDKVPVGFIGGWEPRRQAMLEAVANNQISVKIWGYAWDHLIDGKWTLRRYLRLRRLGGAEYQRIKKSKQLADYIVPREVHGEAFSRAISSSLISLGFLRTVWPDQHTTRTFEIPACGSMMLADRTDEHMSFFEEGKEAAYFSSDGELVEKAVYYSKNSASRARIAAAGHQRCVRSGYSYFHRLRAVLDCLGAAT